MPKLRLDEHENYKITYIGPHMIYPQLHLAQLTPGFSSQTFSSDVSSLPRTPFL